MSATNVDYSTQGATTAQSNARVNSSNNYVSTDEFMKLLITQMTNQDPMNPMEDIDFTGQMANLQALEEQIKTNSVMTAMRVDTQVANVTSMIGKLVSGLDAQGTAVSGVVKQAVVENDVVYVETTSGARLPLDNVAKIWNADANVQNDFKGAQSTIGYYVGGDGEDGAYVEGIVNAVLVDNEGTVWLDLVGGDKLRYANVDAISTWYVDGGEGESLDLASIRAMVGMYVGGEREDGSRGVAKVEDFTVESDGVWLHLDDGTRIQPAKVEQMGSKTFDLADPETDDGDGDAPTDAA